MPSEASLSAAEKALYDRQIRLWGTEAQQRIGSTSVLVVGLGSVAVELIKNLVLAGIGSLTVCDETLLTDTDLGYNFFAEASFVGRGRAEACCAKIQELNSLCSVSICNRDAWNAVRSARHTVVIVQGDYDLMLLNEAARLQGSFFYAVRVDAYRGVAFVDLGDRFECRNEIGVGERAKLGAPVILAYCPFALLPNEPRNDIQRPHSDPVLPHLSAVMAGILGQDLIKVLSRKGTPIHNFLFLESYSAAVKTFLPNSLAPQPPSRRPPPVPLVLD